MLCDGKREYTIYEISIITPTVNSSWSGIRHCLRHCRFSKDLTDYIAESRQQAFIGYFGKHNHFFSFLIDGSVDAGNVEDELVVIQYCKKDNVCEEIRSITRYFAVCNPTQGDADGLLNCLGVALGHLGIEDIQDKSNVLEVGELPISDWWCDCQAIILSTLASIMA